MLLTTNNIKAELSYSYLHAISSRAGCSAEVSGRHTDSAGVDAVIRAKERFTADSTLTQFTIDVQLKATSERPRTDEAGRFGFELPRRNYDTLRNVETLAQQLLVVLYLPEDETQWISHSEDCLFAKRCAYWLSLRGAPAIANTTSRTVYVPPANLFSVEGLRSILTRVSRREWISYEP